MQDVKSLSLSASRADVEQEGRFEGESLRDNFGEYYTPNDEEYKKFIDEGMIVLDANVLLAPYRLDVSTRKQVFSVLETLRDRIWVPYQAGWEYFQNRPGVISGEDKVYANLSKPIEDAKSKVEDHLKTLSGHPVVTDPEKVKILRHLEDALSLIKGLSDGRDEKLEDALRADSVLIKWESILTGRMGTQPTKETRAAYEKLAQERYDKDIPPGYLDRDKKENKYGDALMWLELIDYLKLQSDPPPVLFITNDVKDDWYRRQSGRTIGPRVELVREMREVGVAYYQQRLSAFLGRSSIILHQQVSPEVIKQVSRASAPRQITREYELMVASILEGEFPSIQRRRSFRTGPGGVVPDLVFEGNFGEIGVEIMERSVPISFRDAAYIQALADTNNLAALLVISPQGFSSRAKDFLKEGQRRGGPVISTVEWAPGDPHETLIDAFFDLSNRAQRTKLVNWKK
ncbi:PIN-like domain-containing protein [Streptomyces massasporeus]